MTARGSRPLASPVAPPPGTLAIAGHFAPPLRRRVAAMAFPVHDWSGRGPQRRALYRRDVDDRCPLWHLLALAGAAMPGEAQLDAADATRLAEGAGIVGTPWDAAAFFLAADAFLVAWETGRLACLASALGVA